MMSSFLMADTFRDSISFNPVLGQVAQEAECTLD